MTQPALSVLLPVYNCEPYLSAAISSILDQTEPRFEFIIIDDGSTDASPEIARAFAARDARIRFYCDGVNRGVSARLNQGLSLAQADIIARMDADDISLPERFSRQLDFLQEHPDAVLVGARVIVIDPDGDELREMGDAFTHDEIDSGLMNAGGQLIYHPAVCYRKDIALSIGGYSSDYRGVEDLDFFLKMAERGRVENLREPLLFYREHFNRVGYRMRVEQARAIGAVIAAARARRGLRGDGPELNNVAILSAPMSRAAAHRKWGWWALQSGRKAAARKHAWRSIALRPNAASARLLYCALRGR